MTLLGKNSDPLSGIFFAEATVSGYCVKFTLFYDGAGNRGPPRAY